MISLTRKSFWKYFFRLPLDIQKLAKETYKLFQENPRNTTLDFKRLKTRPERLIYSIRIGRKYRALGVVKGNNIVWFWIGSHEEYNKRIKQVYNTNIEF